MTPRFWTNIWHNRQWQVSFRILKQLGSLRSEDGNATATLRMMTPKVIIWNITSKRCQTFVLGAILFMSLFVFKFLFLCVSWFVFLFMSKFMFVHMFAFTSFISNLGPIVFVLMSASFIKFMFVFFNIFVFYVDIIVHVSVRVNNHVYICVGLWVYFYIHFHVCVNVRLHVQCSCLCSYLCSCSGLCLFSSSYPRSSSCL